ncbi:multidrug effflux MFS transporter [Rhizobium sp. L1K21]|uniref:multidrug effflux MFS transporter n=1 Tax=Rhizobium sp. L1K21 TaxID=2954933 RepID=UPI0020929B37|nr:multidrug effflux MFS transporter [Rhizobium sp. L1K21]MCO6187438.1 multidrug effflux MFS transporter [Rhizobium sp. L1K21]
MKPEIIKLAIILALLSFAGPIAIDMYIPALPRIAHDLGADVSAVQWTVMSFFTAFGISQLVYGPISDSVGRKPPLYFGLGLFFVASLGCALAPSVEWLIALRFVQGIGAASVMSIPRAVIRDLYTGNDATRLMSTIMLVISVAPMLAPLGGSGLIVLFGWPSVFVFAALTALVGILLTRFTLAETLHPEYRQTFELSGMLRAFSVLIKDKGFMGQTMIGGAGMASFFAFLATAPFLYTQHYGLTSIQFSIAFSVNALGFFASSQFAANLGSRYGSLPVVKASVAGFAFTTSLMFVLFLLGFQSFWLLAGLLIISNAFLGLIIPTAMVLSLEEHGPIAGTAAALGGTLQMLVGAVAIVGVSAIFDGGPVSVTLAIAICGIVALGVSLALLGGSNNRQVA